jgi:hypothetical protein
MIALGIQFRIVDYSSSSQLHKEKEEERKRVSEADSRR